MGQSETCWFSFPPFKLLLIRCSPLRFEQQLFNMIHIIHPSIKQSTTGHLYIFVMVSKTNKLYRTGTSLAHKVSRRLYAPRLKCSRPTRSSCIFTSVALCFPDPLSTKLSTKAKGFKNLYRTESEPDRITIVVQLRTGTKSKQHPSEFVSSCDQCCLAVFLTVTLHNNELKFISVELLHT